MNFYLLLEASDGLSREYAKCRALGYRFPSRCARMRTGISLWFTWHQLVPLAVLRSTAGSTDLCSGRRCCGCSYTPWGCPWCEIRPWACSSRNIFKETWTPLLRCALPHPSPLFLPHWEHKVAGRFCSTGSQRTNLEVPEPIPFYVAVLRFGIIGYSTCFHPIRAHHKMPPKLYRGALCKKR